MPVTYGKELLLKYFMSFGIVEPAASVSEGCIRFDLTYRVIALIVGQEVRSGQDRIERTMERCDPGRQERGSR